MPEQSVDLELGGHINFGTDGEECLYLRFVVSPDKVWGYSHLLWITEKDRGRLLEALRRLGGECQGPPPPGDDAGIADTSKGISFRKVEWT